MEIAATVDPDRLQNPEISSEKKTNSSEMCRSECDNRIPKRAKVDDGDAMRRVAEIVMVLSAMGQIRGGREPSGAEKGLMAEAREKLAEMCESLAPKDILTRDAVRVVVEDLGLNKLMDQRLGFRPPKISISEKLALTKRKMEESKELSIQPAPYSSPVLPGFGTKSDGHSVMFQHGGSHMFPPEKPSPMPLSTGTFQSPSPAAPVSALASKFALNPSPVHSEVAPQPAIVLMSPPSSSSLPSDSHSFALPRAEPAHFILDPRSNGPPYLFQVRANSSGDNLQENPPTSAFQSSSVAVSKGGEPIKALDHTSAVEERAQDLNSFHLAPQPVKDDKPKAFTVQTAPVQGLTFVQPPHSIYSTTHNDIARNVQKFLHPRAPDNPKWTSPSIDYMNKLLTCQVCKVTTPDVESLLLCDACEKGTHLKCLQSFNQKGIPKGEWHCSKCLIMSNGKPLPPKYGRVSRNASAPKVPTSSGGIATDKKVENSDQKINSKQKVIGSDNTGILSPHVASMTNKHLDSIQDTTASNIREMQAEGTDIQENDGETHYKISAYPAKERAGEACSLSGIPKVIDDQDIASSELSTSDAKFSTSSSKSLPMVETEHTSSGNKLETIRSPMYQFQSSVGFCEDGKIQSQTATEASENQLTESSNNALEELHRPSDTQQDIESEHDRESETKGRDGIQLISGGKHGSVDRVSDCNKASLEGLSCQDWVGDTLKIVDERRYYKSCCINGVVYKLQDYVLFLLSGDKLSPSKLQVLWEDNNTGAKYAIVNQCYFPDDLPEVVGRPCTPENNEVYESNHGIKIEVGFIRGPCEVLPSNMFKEENLRRGETSNCLFNPVFLCKWFYDESKGLFRPVTD